MPQVKDLCRADFVAFLATLEGTREPKKVAEDLMILAHGRLVPYTSRSGNVWLDLPVELLNPEKTDKPTIKVESGERPLVKLCKGLAFDFQSPSDPYDSPGPSWIIEEPGGASIEWEPDEWCFQVDDMRRTVVDVDQDGTVDEVSLKKKMEWSIKHQEGEMALTVEGLDGQKVLRIFENERETLTIESSKPPSLRTLYKYLLLRTKMLELKTQDVHDQKARGNGAYYGTDERLCEIAGVDAMTNYDRRFREDRRKLSRGSHPYQELLTRVLTGQIAPGQELICEDGERLDSHIIVSRIRANLFVDSSSHLLRLNLLTDDGQLHVSSYDSSWALHILALLWEEEELHKEDSQALMGQLFQDAEKHRKKIFKLGNANKDGDEVFIPNRKETYTHHLIALATYAVRAKDAELIHQLKALLIEDSQRTVLLTEYEPTLVTHLIQVAGILGPELSLQDLTALQGLFDRYRGAFVNALNGKNPFTETYDFSASHALIGLREFDRLGLLSP